ncbi:MarR family winged helix-turn-helix transcriptional regulator [Hydrogenophaga sp.]|uniref:MarR family winged helix-turn-helix transcriptional regulator n=1 Tax=Hydrogenophaga sp. TaxID=1904254 RepID=UPI003562CC08
MSPPSSAPSASPRTRKASSKPSAHASVVDLERYTPAFLTWIANKLSGGASTAYLSAFNVGIETWRLLVLLAIEESLTAQAISRTIGMDKASVSRALKSMVARGLITIALDEQDGRLRLASITPKGRDLHNQILELAMERERAFLSVLTQPERETLIGLLRRLHENLPAVEAATQDYLQRHYPQVRQRRARGSET